MIDQDDNYVSFVGEGTLDEENAIVTITDEVSEMSLGFGVEANDDGSLTLDMGDLGNATVERIYNRSCSSGTEICSRKRNSEN